MEIPELKNTESEMKNSLEALNIILDMAEKRICKLKGRRSAEIIQTGAQREKKKKNKKISHSKASKNCGTTLNSLIYLELQNESRERTWDRENN